MRSESRNSSNSGGGPSKIETAPSLEEEVTLELEQRRQLLQLTEGELENRRTEWVRDKQEAETKRQALRQQYTELKEQRERLVAAGEEGTCPTCARPLGGHFRSVLDVLDAQIETVLVDGNYYKNRMEQLEEAPEEVTASRTIASSSSSPSCFGR